MNISSTPQIRRSQNLRATPPSTEQLGWTVRENLDFIDKGGVLNPESPNKWKEAVDAAKTYLVQPGTQGKNPGGKLYVSQGDGHEVSFVTMHQRAFTRVRPFPSTYNFVQWSEGATPELQQRTGEDNFPVHSARTADEDTVVTIGSVPGSWFADQVVTVYSEENNQWDGDAEAMSLPDLSERGVHSHGAGGYQFDQKKWTVGMSKDSEFPVVELREKYRNDEGRLTTPEQPTALLSWGDGALTWQEAAK